MVAMLISLLLGAAALSVFLSNKRVYGATEGLGRIQESARMAFELMARDIREAGGNPCDVRMKVVNVLTDTAWWAGYGAGIAGFDNGGLAGSAEGTDAIRILFFEDTGILTSSGMANTTGALPVNDNSLIADRQILMVCGFFPSSTTEPVTDTASIFSAGKAAGSITHSQAMGNARDDFSDGAHPVPVVYPAGSAIGRLRALEWYVADSPSGGRSLYRRQLRYPGTAPEMGDPEEIVPDVTDMQLTYLENGTWTLGVPGAWENVTAVQVALNLEARDSRSGAVDGGLIARQLVHVVALRNKL